MQSFGVISKIELWYDFSVNYKKLFDYYDYYLKVPTKYLSCVEYFYKT